MKLLNTTSTRNKILLLIAALFTATFSQAQNGTESPYSRYAIGDLQYNGFARQIAMGGIGAALNSGSYINFDNPASFAHIHITTFETAVRGDVIRFSNSEKTQTNKGGTLGYLALGFPVINGTWGASAGLIPYSNTGYDLKATSEIYNPNDTLTFPYNTLYKGNGNLSRIYFGNGIAPFYRSIERFRVSARYQKLLETNDTLEIKKIEARKKVLKNLSFGITGSYLFGSLSKSRKVEFSSASNLFNTGITEQTAYGDFYFNYGIQYSYTTKKNLKWSLGISGAASTKIKGTKDVLWYNYTTSAFETEEIRDTVYYNGSLKGTTIIPQNWLAGFALQKGEKWMAGADFSMQDWSKYESFGIKEKLANSYKFSMGGQYVPVAGKLNYRAGFKYARTYLDIKETSINDMSASLGIGIPLRLSQIERRVSENRPMIHFTVEAGQRGTLENNLLKEQYLRIYVGLTLNELWFIKRKFD